MASGIFAILDDIGALMDDIAVTTKIATRKTAGILGDDLAVNAEKATGFVSSRELPVIWSITKASFVNKLIIIPIAFLLNFFVPPAIKIILVLGGFYLAYEAVEKIAGYLRSPSLKKNKAQLSNDAGEQVDEKAKIKSAIITDFILSVEIVIISIGTVLDKPLSLQIITVCLVSVLATVGVYGLVALIVRMDDVGVGLLERANNGAFARSIGNLLVKALPVVIKVLSFVGTIALLLVSGGLFMHNIGFIHANIPAMPTILQELLVGLLAGIISYVFVLACKKPFNRITARLRLV